MNDTIFAVSTAQGKAGVAIVRVSGPQAYASAMRLLGGALPEPRRAALRAVLNPASGEVIDSGVVLVFEENESFTGEKTVEYQIHGSFATQNALCDVLFDEPLHRPADPGEFSRRALENGRLDLVQLEGLADLIEAETETQRRQAQSVLRGAFSEMAEKMRHRLIRSSALLEAVLDFSDEDIPQDHEVEVLGHLEAVENLIAEQLRGARAAERIRDGFEVAIVGPPNAGKSTLINAIAGREAAITSDLPGTTRDVIEVRYDLGGLAVTFLDTAGLREAVDNIEYIGVQRAVERARAADLRCFLLDGPAGGEVDLSPVEGDLLVRSKADMAGEPVGDDVLSVSGVTGEGVDDLLEMIEARLASRVSGASFVARKRQRQELESARESVMRARRMVDAGPDSFDLAAEELRFALRNLDRIIGRVGVEDLLDEIFSRFCIGK